jgi:hypothetical protein
MISPAEPGWSETQRLLLSQQHLFADAPKEELRKIPHTFRYAFHCSDVECPGHKLMCTDWEMGESYRKWSSAYGDNWEQKFRLRYESEMIEGNETSFYVGTVASHPHRWIIIGLFYPPKQKTESQGRLF